MLESQRTFLIQELSRFSRFHGIEARNKDNHEAVEQLSVFSLKRKRLILYEAVMWSVMLVVCFSILLFFRKKPLNASSTVLFATMIFGSFGLLLRAMYALGRNRKFRLIVKLLQLEQPVKER